MNATLEREATELFLNILRSQPALLNPEVINSGATLATYFEQFISTYAVNSQNR